MSIKYVMHLRGEAIAFVTQGVGWALEIRHPILLNKITEIPFVYYWPQKVNALFKCLRRKIICLIKNVCLFVWYT